MMTLHNTEVPVTYAMVAMAEHATTATQAYLCYWMAFNNIYTVVATHNGIVPQIRTDRQGNPLYAPPRYGNRRPHMVRVTAVPERTKLQAIFQHFSDDLQDALITHPNITFFLHRTPVWNGVEFEYDGRGQRVNGVINMDHTTHPDHPVWSGIDSALYAAYTQNQGATRTELAEQILHMLYTIRNNLVHGTKEPGDAIDDDVLTKACPLLQTIVRAFLN